MNEVQVLTEAKNLLIDVGWVQNTFESYDGDLNVNAYCATGAIYKTSKDKLTVEAIDTLEHILNPWYGIFILRPKVSLIGWNDKKGRTKKQVIELFDKGIAVALKKSM